MKKVYLYISVLAALLAGCNNFLDVLPKGRVIPSTIEHYHLLLADMETVPIEYELFLTADDFMLETVHLGNLADPDNNVLHLYTYADLRFANPNTIVEAWSTPYKDIYVFNKVINEIDNAKDALGFSADDKKRIKAEALYGRAARYLLLVNMFSKHYNKATAASDLAVPLVMTANLSQKTPKRATVAQVYEQIVKDLEDAIPHLPKMRIEINRPSVGSGYALLARTSLFMGEYEKALKNAEVALAENSKLSNYTTVTDTTIQGIGESCNAEQYTRLFFGPTRGFTNGILSTEMMAMFDAENDSRFTMLLGCVYDGEVKNCAKRENGYNSEPNILPSVPEMYITVAECCARTNRGAEALQKLNALRKNRIKGVADKTAADFATPDALLKFTLEERRREMFMTGIRLFDLKRLNLDPRFAKTVVHTVGKKTYEAGPNSEKLVLPIPMNVQKFSSK